jgi:hypothetical protein
MDIVPLVITVVSIGAALTMAVLARSAGRAERLRSAARVAALRAAADTEPAEPMLAERVAVGEARLPAAWPRPARPSGPASARSIAPQEVLSPTTLGDGFLGSTGPSGSGGRQRGLAVAAVLLFAVALGGGYWAVFTDRTPAAAASPATTSGQALELVSLRHERRGAKLNVVGLVRNPAGGRSLDKLTAVVFLFDRQGGFLSSARASVDYLTLVPGDETPFVIAMDAPASVARYRVSFRNDGGVVPHIDRRGQEPIAAQAVTSASVSQRGLAKREMR